MGDPKLTEPLSALLCVLRVAAAPFPGMGTGSSKNHDVDIDAVSIDELRREAAKKIQATARGSFARKDYMVKKMRGEVMMRTNLPKRWRTVDGVPGGLELEGRRYLAFVGQHLIVFKMRLFGMSKKVGRAEFVIAINRIERVRRRAGCRGCASAHANP